MNNWEDDVKTMLSGNWRPRTVGGFSVTFRSCTGMILMYPPQGIYAVWRGVFVDQGTGTRVSASGRDPGSALSALEGAVETKGLRLGVDHWKKEND